MLGSFTTTTSTAPDIAPSHFQENISIIPMDLLKTKVPPIKDLTVDNITENVIRINSQGPDPRFTYVLERLVSHMHDFARETRLNTKEWMAGLEFLTAVGQTCTDVRQVHGASSYLQHNLH